MLSPRLAAPLPVCPCPRACAWFVVVGLTTVSQSETEAAALQQAKKKKKQRRRSGGAKIPRPYPPAWFAENTERNKKTIRD